MTAAERRRSEPEQLRQSARERRRAVGGDVVHGGGDDAGDGDAARVAHEQEGGERSRLDKESLDELGASRRLHSVRVDIDPHAFLHAQCIVRTEHDQHQEERER